MVHQGRGVGVIAAVADAVGVHMVISRPFLITLLAFGYIITGLVETLTGIGVPLPEFVSILVRSNRTLTISVGILQIIYGMALFRGAWWAWWLVILGAWVAIITHVIDGLRGESWAWGIIVWNLIVQSYMQSRDIQAFFGREAY